MSVDNALVEQPLSIGGHSKFFHDPDQLVNRPEAFDFVSQVGDLCHALPEELSALFLYFSEFG